MENRVISFENCFDAVLCLDANLPGREVFGILEGLPIIAADGAALRLHEKGVPFDYVVGDLDTFYSEPAHKEIDVAKIRHYPDQETNDFEKALVYALSQGYDRILVIGFHGGLLEHSLNNWSVFAKFSQKANLCIYDKGRYGIAATGNLEMLLIKDEIVSLIPQPEAIVSTRGLSWELDEEELKLGKREGARNKAIAERIELTIHAGSLLIFIDQRLPGAPVYR